MRGLAPVALLFLSALLACGGGERLEAEGAVRAYNRTLVEAYRLSDPGRMEAVATPREVRKIWALVDLKRSAGLVLESTLESLDVTGVRRPTPGTLEVETRERWRYHDRALKPGTPAGPTFVAEMTLRYHFIRDGGVWRMDRGETLSSETLESSGLDTPGAAAAEETP